MKQTDRRLEAMPASMDAGKPVIPLNFVSGRFGDTTTRSKREWICPTCRRRFMSEFALKGHMRSHK